MWQRLRQARLAWPSALTAGALLLLIGLGVWQLERLQWKEALLAQIAARVTAAPVPLAAVERRWQAGEDVNYLHARARGRFLHDKERYLYAPRPEGLGWHVYTPLEIAPGRILWVNRGWVDDAHRGREARAAGTLEGEVEVAGLVRQIGAPGHFTPLNDTAHNLFYWPDLAAMTASAFAAPAPATLPFRLEADLAPAPPGGLPQGGVTRLDLPNRHFGYALTWFGLALTLIAVYLSFARARLRLGAAPNSGPDPR